jgi:5'-3' exonuclease
VIIGRLTPRPSYTAAVDVYLVDGTYELFRHFFAVPSHVTQKGEEIAAARGVVASVLGMLEGGNEYVGVATDQVIESFRNDMWPGYKTGEGIDPLLWAQFPIVEEGLEAMGVTVFAMVELEADDALGAAAKTAAADPRVDRVYVCSPDKDMGQCVTADGRIVQLDRRKRLVMDEAAVTEKFGVLPVSIPDYLALVGDSADGYPGLPGWGAKSTAAVLQRYTHLESIPDLASQWDVPMRGADKLAATLAANRDLAMLFRDLATLRSDAPVLRNVDDLHWKGPTPAFEAFCARVEQPSLMERAVALAKKRS